MIEHSIEEILAALRDGLRQAAHECHSYRRPRPWPYGLVSHTMTPTPDAGDTYPEILAAIRGKEGFAFAMETRSASDGDIEAMKLWAIVRSVYATAFEALQRPLPVAQHRLAVLLGVRPIVAPDQLAATIRANGRHWASLRVESYTHWAQDDDCIEHPDILPPGYGLARLPTDEGVHYVIVRPEGGA